MFHLIKFWIVVSELFMFAVYAELNRVAKYREDLHKSQMKLLDENCRKAQERVCRLANIKTLETEIEEKRTRSMQKLQQLCEHREQLERSCSFGPFVNKKQTEGIII